MSKTFALVISLLLWSCAQDAGQVESVEERAAKIVAGLPDAGCTLYSSGGAHQFCGGAVEQVTTYDCGMRSGFMCFHYAHTADAQNPVSHSESSCTLPYTGSGTQCQP